MRKYPVINGKPLALPRKKLRLALQLHDYLPVNVLPDVTTDIDWTPAVLAQLPNGMPDGTSWGMLGNDVRGNCAECAVEHASMVDAANVGNIVPPTLEQTLALYTRVAGFDPAQDTVEPDGSISNPTDQGTAWTDLLAWLQSNGYISAWLAYDHSNYMRHRQAVAYFNNALIGAQIRQSDMDAFDSGKPWTAGTDAVEGMHAIPSPKITAQSMTFITWGQAHEATPEWVVANVLESYAVVTPLQLNNLTQRSPTGLNLSALLADIRMLAS